MPNNHAILPSVTKLDADLERNAQMNRRYSPAVIALSKVLAQHFTVPTAPAITEDRRLVAVG